MARFCDKDRVKKRYNISLTEDERDKLQRKANRFCNGNLSQYLALAGIKYKPIAKK